MLCGSTYYKTTLGAAEFVEVLVLAANDRLVNFDSHAVAELEDEVGEAFLVVETFNTHGW